ncbi:unnamed protein product [Clavelina lepadiformis]|uniref:Uncharacterized protein n=1 Tax=Clavelina lepadiformis TaxID=159417 RepID=A0ABP0GM94_CLALP
MNEMESGIVTSTSSFVENWQLTTQSDSTNNETTKTVAASYGIFAKCFSVFNLVISLYILLALGMYTWKIRGRLKVTPIANHLCTLAAVAGVVSALLKMLHLCFGLISFSSLNKAAGAIYFAGFACIFTLVWARQRSLYSNELLASATNNKVKIASTIVIFIIFACGSAIAVNFQAALRFNDSEVVWETDNAKQAIFACALCIAAVFILQFVLFLLILFPLLGDRNLNKCDIVRSKLQKDIHRMLVRLALCTVACVFSTVLTNLVIILNVIGVINIFWSNLATLDLIISNVFTILTFVDWWKKLLPFCCHNQFAKLSRISTTTNAYNV